MLNGEKLKAFPLKSGTGTRRVYPLFVNGITLYLKDP
jgi:hypothetical protein